VVDVFFFWVRGRGRINSLSVHPSGRLLLSVGKDKTLRTWNLIKGRSAFITNLKQGSNSNERKKERKKEESMMTQTKNKKKTNSTQC
jgi:WD40 repeat protein